MIDIVCMCFRCLITRFLIKPHTLKVVDSKRVKWSNLTRYRLFLKHLEYIFP